MSSDRLGPYISFYKNVVFIKDGTRYPHCCMVDGKGRILHPVKERIMSLSSAPHKEPAVATIPYTNRNELKPLFFFIYNTDNYFHFLYDTLPYLLAYERLKKTNPYLKLLMQRDKPHFYPFVEEALRLLGIDPILDVVLVEDGVRYAEVFVSDSLTHGIQADDPPNPKIFDLYDKMVDTARFLSRESHPKKIYVSRRSWLHGDASNMGTDYTSRRKLINEDEVVELTKSRGYQEVFAEKLSFIEKIAMFSNATHIVGAIGGGLANCLFSRGQLLTLVSPTFLDINGRFSNCFKNVDTTYFMEASHVDQGPFKKYMRISHGDLIGEIEEIYDESLLVYYTTERVAGWNSTKKYDRITLRKDQCIPLDSGLNSPWKVDINKLASVLK